MSYFNDIQILTSYMSAVLKFDITSVWALRIISYFTFFKEKKQGR